MFTKLLKHEWKASAGLLGILSLAVLGIGIAGGFVLRYIFEIAQTIDTNDAILNAVLMPLMLLLIFLIFALVAYAVAVQIILLSRFYKSRFTDEGYLTFTLPVNGSQIFLSALTNILIWTLLSGLVLGVSALIMLGIGTHGMAEFSPDPIAMEEFFGIYRELWAMEGYAEYQILAVVYNVISFFSGPVLIMTCITLGATLAKKHKILAAIGLYYGVSMAISMIGSMTEVASVMDGLTGEIIYSQSTLIHMSVQILVQVVLAIGGSILSIFLVDKKLNLP